MFIWKIKSSMGFSKKDGGLKLETVPVVVYCYFVLHKICEVRKNCEVDDQEVQAQIQRHKRDEEKTPNRPDAFYLYINSEEQKIGEVIKEYFEHYLPDAF